MKKQLKKIERDIRKVLKSISKKKFNENEYQLLCETLEDPPVKKEVSESEVEKFFEIVSYVVTDVREGRITVDSGTYILMDNLEETYL